MSNSKTPRFLLSTEKLETGIFRAILWELSESSGAISVTDIVEASGEIEAISTIRFQSEYWNSVVGVKCSKYQNLSEEIGNHHMVSPEFMSIEDLASIVRTQEEIREEYFKTDEGIAFEKFEFWKDKISEIIESGFDHEIPKEKIFI